MIEKWNKSLNYLGYYAIITSVRRAQIHTSWIRLARALDTFMY